MLSNSSGFTLHQFELSQEDLPLVEFMYLVFACMPGESSRS